jgi:hypothetical protein
MGLDKGQVSWVQPFKPYRFEGLFYGIPVNAAPETEPGKKILAGVDLPRFSPPKPLFAAAV